MGFLTAYEGTTRFPIPHPEKDYWIDLKQHISQGATEKAQSHMQSVTLVNGQPCPQPNAIRMRQELVLASIAGWNLDDANGTVWPVDLAHVRKLPEAVFEKVYEVIEGSNEPLPARERAQFHGGGVGGDSDGDGGPGVVVDVPVAGGVLDAPGDAA